MDSEPINLPPRVRKRIRRKPKPEESAFSEPQEIETPFEIAPAVTDTPATGAAERPAAATRGFKDHSTLLLALALILFLVSQAANLDQSARSLQWQARTLDRQVETLDAAQQNLVIQVQQRQAVVEQSQRVTASYNELLNDLIRLAESDSDARAVVEKFQIKSAATSAEASTSPTRQDRAD